MIMNLQGCYTAIVTPFRDGRIDYEAFGRIIEKQIEGGVDGIVPAGTTGESPTLDFSEHEELIEFTVKTVNKRCLVIAGTGGNSTAEAIRLTRDAATKGADATLQVTPYYNKPNQEGLYRHFSEIADQGGLPVVLYNVPGRTGREIAVETAARLSRHPGVVAIKEATGDIDRASELATVCPSLAVLSGDDSMTLPRMAVGGKGVISVAANAAPEPVARMVHLALRGEWDEARKLHLKLFPFFRDLFIDTNPIPVKAAMAMRGLISEEYRLPLCSTSEENKNKLRESMRNAGLQV